MPPPKRRRPSRPSAPPPAPVEPLGVIVRDYENWRRGQSAKPGKGALREYWRQRDAKQGQRPDYLLWRQTQCLESPPEKRQDSVELALRALRAQDPVVYWAGLALAPALLEAQAPALNPARRAELVKAMLGRLGDPQRPLPPLSACPSSSALMSWICRAMVAESPTMLKELGDLLVAIRADWKPGRSADLGFLTSESWLPVPRAQVIRWLVAAITRMVRQAGMASLQPEAAPNQISLQENLAWHLTAWMMLRDARPLQSASRVEELEVLLDAAGTARIAGDAHEAARLTALALNLASPQMPEAFLQRCRVAAWTLAEAGLATPTGLRVRLDDLPFPGDPPASEKGLEAARLFYDAADVARQALAKEVAEDPDWQRLRTAGIMLHHPLAALAWIGKKAQSYVVKKQQDLLQAAASLAARHHCLGTTGRILAQSPGSAAAVLAYAQAMRQSLRRMPVLRDDEAWQEWAADLRTAWGKLDTDAIHDPEVVFMLHETLLDRQVTTLRCLPEDLRVLALRHLHGRRSPSALVQALEAEPKLMQSLVHQRTLELWALAADMRERPEQAGTAWVSLVARGDAASGKYSLLVHGPAGRVQSQGRLRAGITTPTSSEMDLSPLAKEIAEAVGKVCAAPEWVLLAVDGTWLNKPWPALLRATDLTASVALIPSWEWAFRVLRESAAAVAAVSYETLLPEGAAPPAAPVQEVPAAGPLARACVLLAGTTPSDANTRWTAVVDEARPAEERLRTRRSLSIGEHPLVISYGPLHMDAALNADLIRLSLAQTTRCVVSPAAGLTAAEQTVLETLVIHAPLSIPFADRLRSLTEAQSKAWVVSGLPWVNSPGIAERA